MMKFVILTLFPEFFVSPLETSLLGKAVEKNLLSFEYINIRDYALNNYGQVDDTPYGGGHGMIMRPEPLAAAIQEAKKRVDGPVIYFTPAGNVLTQDDVEQCATLDSCILLCGRYEGIDQRIIDKYVDIEISLGRFILQGGEVAALTFIESVSRHIPGIIGNAKSIAEESFSPELDHRIEHPLYTKPEEFEGMRVPDVLLSGHHKNIEDWKKKHLR